MIRRSLQVGLTVLGAAVTGIVALSSRAADHIDGPSATKAPEADITDVYSWMSADGSKVNLVMNVLPFATSTSKFSDKVLHVFHVNSAAKYGDKSTETNVVCGFDAAQKVSCWVGKDEYVTGDASARTGLVSKSGKTKVFAGIVDDPFFFNLEGFKATVASVVAAAPSLKFDEAGCPALDAATSTVLVTQLKTLKDGKPGTNFFAGKNVGALILQIDKTLLAGGGPVLGIWASTHSR